MNRSELKSIIQKEIDPSRCFLRRSKLDIELWDRAYDWFASPEAVEAALKSYTPLPYIPDRQDCEDQAIDVKAYLRRKDITVGLACSAAHTVKSLSALGRIDAHVFCLWPFEDHLWIVEGRDAKVMSYRFAQEPQFNGVYDLSKGQWVKV